MKTKKNLVQLACFAMLCMFIPMTSCDVATSKLSKSKQPNAPPVVKEKMYTLYIYYSDPNTAQIYNGGDAVKKGLYWADDQAEWQEFIQDVSPNVSLVTNGKYDKAEIKDFFLNIGHFNENDATDAMNILTSAKSFRLVFYLNSSVNRVFYVVKYAE